MATNPARQQLCAFDDDPGVSLCPATDPLGSPDGIGSVPPVTDTPRFAPRPGVTTAMTAWSLRAAVPGGLCLLI